MKNLVLREILYLATFLLFSSYLEAKDTGNVFKVAQPDYKLSPLTGMTRNNWIDAAEYLLGGAFNYIHSMDDPMKFPKQLEKSYPRNDAQIPTEKLEGFCRTLFVAAPLLREKPDLVLNNTKVAEYYQHNLIKLFDPHSPNYIRPRGNGGPSQILVEFGALAISLSIIPEILWDPLSKAQKDSLAATMLSYGDGPTIESNWRFFNIFILSFFKDKGYPINEKLLTKYLDNSLAAYRDNGWYNDSPAYDYYSMWAFQMYGPVWAQLYGKKYYPDYAEKFINNLSEMVDNYPYMFNKEGQMNMWGRSISYRFGAVIPLALTSFLHNSTINYGWMRRISSGTLLQFLQNPQFLEDGIPSLGFYGPFAPATQIYSCRGSVFWMGKAFLALALLPSDSPFWTATENNGAWKHDLKKEHVYNKFQPGSNLLITDYPNSGAAEMRSWCHESVANDWQQFRSSENYNKLAYNTDFPWMADGENEEISMNYGVRNSKNKWEVLRLYTFVNFENGIYRRDAELESNNQIKFKLADIPLADGILRIDKVIAPEQTAITLGHYSLPQLGESIRKNKQKVGGRMAYILNNGEYELAMIALNGWSSTDFIDAQDLHPVSKSCSLINAKDTLSGEKIYVTLQLWKKGKHPFSKKELSPVKSVSISQDKQTVEITLRSGERKIVQFN